MGFYSVIVFSIFWYLSIYFRKTTHTDFQYLHVHVLTSMWPCDINKHIHTHSHKHTHTYKYHITHRQTHRHKPHYYRDRQKHKHTITHLLSFAASVRAWWAQSTAFLYPLMIVCGWILALINCSASYTIIYIHVLMQLL